MLRDEALLVLQLHRVKDATIGINADEVVVLWGDAEHGHERFRANSREPVDAVVSHCTGGTAIPQRGRGRRGGRQEVGGRRSEVGGRRQEAGEGTR